MWSSLVPVSVCKPGSESRLVSFQVIRAQLFRLAYNLVIRFIYVKNILRGELFFIMS